MGTKMRRMTLAGVMVATMLAIAPGPAQATTLTRGHVIAGLKLALQGLHGTDIRVTCNGRKVQGRFRCHVGYTDASAGERCFGRVDVGRKHGRLRAVNAHLSCKAQPTTQPPPNNSGAGPAPPTAAPPAAPGAPPVDPNQPSTLPPTGLPPIAPPPGPHGSPPSLSSTGMMRSHKVVGRTADVQTFAGCTGWQLGYWDGWPYLNTYTCFFTTPTVFGTSYQLDTYFLDPGDNQQYYWFTYFPVL